MTALDPYGNPAPGVVVHFVVTGDNPQTANVTTGADGKATFSYSGTTMGDDTVVISATITTTVITLDPIHVQWGSAIGTPCTGRATPLDVVLVVDVSGSMVLDAVDVHVSAGKLEAAQAAANRFIDNLNPTRDQVGLVVFRAGVDRFAPLSLDSANAKTQLASGIEGGIFCASNFCDPGAPAPISRVGLDAALDELESPRHRAEAQKVIVYIGDGGADGGDEARGDRAPARFGDEGGGACALGRRRLRASTHDLAVARQVATTANDYFYAPSGRGRRLRLQQPEPGPVPQPGAVRQRGRRPGRVQRAAARRR